MLFFKKRYFEAIRAGTKTTTLRYWRSPRVKPDSTHWVRGLGQLRIEAVKVVQFNELTDDDASRDGFENLRELQKSLDEYYPPEDRTGRKLYQIKFHYIAT